jgi:hypothetical protein
MPIGKNWIRLSTKVTLDQEAYQLMTLIYIAVAGAVLFYVFRPLFTEQGEVARVSGRETKRVSLVEQRDRALEAIREVDFDHRMGKTEGDDYKETRARYEAEALALINELDKGNGRAGEIEDLVEQEIASARKKG